MKFVDTCSIHVQAGDGGAGCVSFRREKYVPRGGPDGGNGGRGGSVVIKANRHLSTLLDFQFKKRYAAQRGEHGLGAFKTGKSAADVVLEVPVGTVATDEETGEILADLVRHGDEVVMAEGGFGGRGNAAFATSTNQAPREYELGTPGEKRTVTLELKLLADVGFVGFPNVGKSTLISTISAARPKIADYPFTTLVPNLGIVRVGMGSSFVVADIPGLIKGAHEGKGLGIRFLRHIERTKVLLFLLDATSNDPKADYEVLLRELKLFDAGLLRKPRLVAITKIDIIDPPALGRMKKIKFARIPVLPISAATGARIPELVQALWKRVSAIHRREDSVERISYARARTTKRPRAVKREWD